MNIRSIPLKALDPITCEECDANLVETLRTYSCKDCDLIIAKPIPIYYSPLNTKKEAYQLLNTLFSDVLVINVPLFVKTCKYRPVVASIFVVSLGGSYILGHNKCNIVNGTLSSIGNLQVSELQDAYLNKRNPNLPIVKSMECPMCAKVSRTKTTKNTILCDHCCCMYYI